MVKKLTDTHRRVLIEMVEKKCQYCGRHQDICGTLEIHRLKRGCRGGEYTPDNILVLCNSCHKEFHGKEIKMEDLSPCLKCNCMTKSIKKARAVWLCEKCGENKTLSDVYFNERVIKLEEQK